MQLRTGTICPSGTDIPSSSGQKLMNITCVSVPDPETPLPSTEQQGVASSEQLSAINTEYRPRTPSISLSPPPQSEHTPASDATPSRCTSYAANNSTVRSINERIAGLDLAGITKSADGCSSHLVNEREHGTNEECSTREVNGNHLADGLAAINLSPPTLSREASSDMELLRPISAGSELSVESTANSRQSTPKRRSSSAVDLVPHSVDSEEPPANHFHEAQLQSALSETRGVIADLLHVLESSTLYNEPDSAMRKLHQQARDQRDFKSPAARIVGLVGDSGVGKSSLINSLLDIQNFARTSSSGAACTCVVTEYHYHDQNYITLRTEYFSQAAIEAQFIEMLMNFRNYNALKTKSNGELADHSELKDLEGRAKIACDTFRAAFRGGNKFEENELLITSEDIAKDILLDTIRRQYNNNVPVTGSAEEKFTDDTLCSSRLMHLTSDLNDPTVPTHWPFIQKISVKMKAHILSKGLILADLPGLRDLNRARVNITERYLLNCHQIFSVCNIARATTDEGVDQVFELAKKANLSNVGIICTRSDDIRAEEAEHDWKGKNAFRIKEMRAGIKNIDVKLADIDRKIAELEWESDTEYEQSSDDDDEELPALRRQKDKWAKKKAKAVTSLNEFLITVRNNKIVDELQNERGSELELPLRVFCISNILYWDHRQKPRKQSLPFLNLSGILDLRKYCLSIVAESQLHAAKQYIRDAVPALLGSLQLWIDSGAGTANAETKELVRLTVSGIRHQLSSFSESDAVQGELANLLKQHFREQISHVMGRSMRRWAYSAREAALQWGGWHWASYAAFCRNYGDYCTPAVGRRCWNDEAIELMVRRMNQQWVQFVSAAKISNNELLVDVQDIAFVEARKIAITAASTNDTISTLARTLNHRKHLLAQSMEEILEEFESDLARLKTDTLTGIQSSFTGRSLEATYAACNRDCGTGVHARRRSKVEGRFGGEQLFHDIHSLLRRDFSETADKLQNSVNQEVRQHIGVIMQDLDVLMDEHAATESESNPILRSMLQAELDKANATLTEVQHSILTY